MHALPNIYGCMQSFWVITKYRSFIRKTKQIDPSYSNRSNEKVTSQWTAVDDNLCIPSGTCQSKEQCWNMWIFISSLGSKLNWWIACQDTHPHELTWKEKNSSFLYEFRILKICRITYPAAIWFWNKNCLNIQ